MRLDSNGISLARGDVRDPAALELSEGAYEGVLPELALRYAQMTHEPESWALRAVYQMTAERVLARLRAGRRAEPCCAGRRSVVITDVGDVQACEPLTAPLGSLRESGYDVMRVLRSDRARHVLASIQARECTCTWECAIASSIVFTPGEYPRVLARILRNAVAFARRPRHGTSRRAGGPGPT
jgi:MoaA/NifB/PqqE/SkfB family radical SAM enzyme